ncbi:hypothetical protein [Mangrovimonas cancribranchiae]|uniref:Uncharacterized protein n=1 Tax=Mangrovimonas cancribranchiae TaxID=3080055 RepID=A0AAU6NX41_9FLAO
MNKEHIYNNKNIDRVNDWLNKPKHAIQIINADTGVEIRFTPNPDNPKRHFANWTLDDILSRSSNIYEFFINLYEKDIQAFIVKLKKPNGTSYKVQDTFKIELVENSMLRNGEDKGATQVAPVQTTPTEPNYQNHSPMQHLGGLGAAAQAAGLGFNDLVNLKAKAEKYDELKEQFDELKADKRKLDLDNKELQSKVNTAAKELDLAIKEAKLDQKGIMDSPAVTKLAESLPTFIPLLLEQKHAHSGNHSSNAKLEQPELSESKQGLIDWIKSDDITDEVAENFYSVVLHHANSSDEFRAELQQLLNKHTA